MTALESENISQGMELSIDAVGAIGITVVRGQQGLQQCCVLERSLMPAGTTEVHSHLVSWIAVLCSSWRYQGRGLM